MTLMLLKFNMTSRFQQIFAFRYLQDVKIHNHKLVNCRCWNVLREEGSDKWEKSDVRCEES